MRARWLINLMLLLAVAVLVVLIRAELNQARLIQTLTDLAPSDIYRLEIAREGETTIELVQTMHSWRMTAPLDADVDPEPIERLLGLLAAPVQRSFPSTGAALDQLELAPSRLKLRLDGRELEFGGIDPIGQARYVASEGVVHLIDDRFYPLLIAPPIRYVSPSLLPSGFNPVFGRLDGVPLAADALAKLKEARAERVEVLAEELDGRLVMFRDPIGDTLRFSISEDLRRWARPDQRLLYVLASAPELTLDPDAIDPTPPEPLSIPDGQDGLQTADPADMADPFGPPADGDGRYDVMETDPDSPVPSDIELGAPPVVRLTPDGRLETTAPQSPPRSRAEPDQQAPQGFGVDPFAPDPAMY